MGAYADHTFEGVPTQGQRPCKTMPHCFWKSGTELLLTRPQSHQHCAKWHTLRRPAGAPASRLQTTPCSLQQHKHPDSKAPIDILQPHQHPGPKVFQRAEGRFWAVQCFEYGLIRTWAGGQSVHPSLRGAYAKPTPVPESPGRNLVKHSAQARALWPLQQQAGGKRRTSRLQLAWTASGLSCSVALV